MTLYIASDHAGFELKKYLITFLKAELKITAQDMGPAARDNSDDFPDFAAPLARQVAQEPGALGILICSTGQGMCIVANKIKGIRAIIGYSIAGAEIGRKHNDANILCLAGQVLTPEHASAVVKKFLQTAFDGDERLVRRNKKIEALEQQL